METGGIARSVLLDYLAAGLEFVVAKKQCFNSGETGRSTKQARGYFSFASRCAQQGDVSLKSNLLAKILEHQNSRIFFNSKHRLTFPPPIFRKLSKCSNSDSLSAAAIESGSSNNRSGSPR